MCGTANHISAEEIEKVRQTVDKTTVQASNDLKCFAKCVVDASGVLKTGELDIDRLVRLSELQGKNGAEVRTKAEMCKDKIPSAVNCDDAWSMYACIY